MLLLIFNWSLSLLILIFDLRLLILIISFKEQRMLFGLLQFLIINDCLGSSVIFWHDIPSYFRGESIFNDVKFLYSVAVIFQCLQFFYGVFMLPVFAAFNCAAVYFPFWYNRSRTHLTYCIVLILYITTAALTVPLFTSCCGYGYNETTRSWYYDNKPYTYLFQTGFFWGQMVGISVMVFCLGLILYKLYKLRVPVLSPSKQTNQVVAVQPLPHSNTGPTYSGATVLRFTMNPRERLALSFVVLALCFLIGTATFNLLGWSNPVAFAITMLCNQLNKAKWIIYSLFLPDVRELFFRFRRST